MDNIWNMKSRKTLKQMMYKYRRKLIMTLQHVHFRRMQILKKAKLLLLHAQPVRPLSLS
jgi:hypothetical protein